MKNKSKIIVIALVIVVLVAAGLVAWLLLENGEKDKATKPTDETTSQDGGKNTDLAGVVKKLPNQSAIEQLFTEYLRGYWQIPNRGEFVVFAHENGAVSFGRGLWDSDFGEQGKVTAARATGEYEVELTVHFPAVAPNMLDDGRPEKTETITIDMVEVNAEFGSIRIKTASSNWAQYDFSGRTYEEAYARTH